MKSNPEVLLPILALQEGFITVEEFMELRRAAPTEADAGATLRLRLSPDQVQHLISRIRQIADEAGTPEGDTTAAGATVAAGPGNARPDAAAGKTPVPDARSGIPTVLAVVDPRRSGPQSALSLTMAAVDPADRDRYEFVAEKGQGGMGRVWIALDRHMGREVAVKELIREGPTAPGEQDTTFRRFLREALVTGQLEHPGIVPVYEIGHNEDGSLFYTMRLLRGRTLRVALSECRSLRQRLQLIPHFRDLCLTIAYAHSRGVIHRDLKPDNIIIGEFGETMVLDWGIAKIRGQSDEFSSRIVREMQQLQAVAKGDTVAGDILGTPAYMPPEQACGKIDEIDEQSDLYSLGVVLYELLAGRPPYSGHPWKVLAMVQKGRPDRLEALDPEIPKDLAAVAHKAISPDKALRYDGVRELAGELDSYMSGQKVGVYDYSLLELARLFFRHHRGLAVSIAVSALLIAVAVAAVLVQYRRATEATAVAVENQRKARQSQQTAQQNEQRARESERVARTKSSESALNLALTFSEKSRTLIQAHHWDAAAAYAAEVLRLHPLIPGSQTWDPGAGLDSLAAQRLRTRVVSALAFSGYRSPLRFEAAWRFPGPVAWMASSEEKNLIAFAEKSGRIWISDLRGGPFKPLRMQHEGGIRSLQFFPGSDRLLVNFSGEPTEIWDASEGRRIQKLAPPWDTLGPVSISGPQEIAGVDVQKGIQFVDVRTWKVTATWPVPDKTTIQFLVFLDDGRLCGAATQDNRVLVWERPGGRLLGDFRGHQSNIKRILYDRTRNRVITAGNDRTLRFWDLKTGPAGVLEGHGSSVTAAVLHPSGRWLLSGSFDADTFVWDLLSMRDISRHGGHTDAVTDLLLSRDGRFLHTASADGTVRRWRFSFPEQPVILEGQKTGAYDTVVLSGGSFASAHGDRNVRIWDLKTLSVRFTLSGHGGEVYALAASADRKRLASIDGGGELILWDPVAGARLFSLKGHQGWGMALAFSPDGRTLYSGGEDKLLHVWDLEKRTEAGRFALPDSVFSLLPAGDHLLIGLQSGRILQWDRHRNQIAAELDGHQKCASGLALSPKKDLLVSTGMDRRVILWRQEKGKWIPKETLEFQENWVSKVRFSSGGDWFATTSDDHSVALWKVGEPVPRRIFHTRKEAMTVDFLDPTGQLLVGDEQKFLLYPLEFPEQTLTPVQWQAALEKHSGMRLSGVRYEPVPPTMVQSQNDPGPTNPSTPPF